MPLVNATCTNCGAGLQVDNAKAAAICPYCGSAYIVEKAINNYNTVNNIQASVVNIYGGNSSDFVIHGGILEEYTGASIDVVIPSGVLQIGKAFKGMKYLRSVILPDTIKEIDEFAFAGCNNLESIVCSPTIGSVVVGKGAFAGCTKLNIPDALAWFSSNNTYACPVCSFELKTTDERLDMYKCPRCGLPGRLFYLKP